jgi:hypothetical protein
MMRAPDPPSRILRTSLFGDRPAQWGAWQGADDLRSGAHNPKIMLGMLVKVLCGDAIVTCKRLPREKAPPVGSTLSSSWGQWPA